MSESRRMAVLRAIVQDYVQTSEPVGSKALLERHALGVSAATVRNDMAALEDEGLIMAPHTSAGRIPTDAGYRLFVDRLSEIKPLSVAERAAIENFLDATVRAGIDPVQLYISIASLCYFYLSNNPTLSTVFGRDLRTPKAMAERLSHMTDLVLGYALV